MADKDKIKVVYQQTHAHKLAGGLVTGSSEGDPTKPHSHSLPGGGSTSSDVGTGSDNHTHTYKGGESTSGPIDIVERKISSRTVSAEEFEDDFDSMGDAAKDKPKPAQLFTIEGVEVFSEGVWNGDPYHAADLDEMVRAFEENKSNFKPFIKLGHNKEQKLLQKDGLPRAGRIDNLRREGKKLIADFVDLPRKIFQLIQNKAFTDLSSEIYWNVSIAGKKFKRILSAVSLLGADHPAVSSIGSLDDYLNLFINEKIGKLVTYGKDAAIKTYSFSELKDREENEMPEQTAKEAKLEMELETLKKDFSKSDGELTELRQSNDANVKSLKEYKDKQKEYSDKIEAYKSKEKELKQTAFLAKLEKENLLVPSMKPYVIALMGEDKKEYSIKQKDGSKNYSKEDLIESILKLHSATDVNLDENSLNGDDNKDRKPNDQEAFEAKMQDEISKYALDNKVEESEAYKVISKKYKFK